MNTTEARDLLNGRWLSLGQDEFDIAIQQLIHEHGGDHWLHEHPHVLLNPKDLPSQWQGIVRFPEESLMPFRSASYQGQTIYLNEEDIAELTQ